MSDLIKRSPDIDKISRFQSLQAGQYWRAVKEIPEQGIAESTVLLLQSIKWVDDAAHTIVMRSHPNKIGSTTTLHIPREDGTILKVSYRYDKHLFLLQGFLTLFEYEPDSMAVRSREVSDAQARVAAIQSELVTVQRDPALMADVVEKELKKRSEDKTEPTVDSAPLVTRTQSQALMKMAAGSMADVIGTGITTELIESLKQAANNEHTIATIKAQWIQGMTADIAAAIRALTPYYDEQAAAALAQTEDVRTFVAKLLQGIESLDLYTGKDVAVTTVREGAAAPSTLPLTFVQQKLMMDEELSVWADVDEWFDFSDQQLFFDALRNHDSLVQQIFPTERYVLVMAVTRRHINYESRVYNFEAANSQVFMLVRNGMNIHRVLSPVESHLNSSNLFPSRDSQDAIFRGLDGTQIKFEDVAYTGRLAAHEAFALHYKRFLLLICGLDHRLKLFGDFYEGPANLNFVSMEFQAKYCRFLHDADGTDMLPKQHRLPVLEWIAEKNAYLCSGSRVLGVWDQLMTAETAPSAFRGSEYLRFPPCEEMSTVIVHRKGQSFCVDVPVAGKPGWAGSERRFNCKVNLSAVCAGKSSRYLCLDAVQQHDLKWYIHDRTTRRNHLHYIKLFKFALKFLQEEMATEADTRQRLARALSDGSVAHGKDVDTIIHQAVVAWRADNRGKSLPQFINGKAPAAWTSLLNQMYMLAGAGERQADDIADFVSQLGYEPLRLALSASANLVIYAAPHHNRLEQHVWVHRITIERGKTRYIEKARRWEILPKVVASETTLRQWPVAEAWLGRTSIFDSFNVKQKLFAKLTRFEERLSPFCSRMTEATFNNECELWREFRSELLLGSNRVHNPSFAVPFGIVYYPNNRTLEAQALLLQLAPNEASKSQFRDMFTSAYQNVDAVRKKYLGDTITQDQWGLLETSIDHAFNLHQDYAHEKTGVTVRSASGKSDFDPLLAGWFSNWIQSGKRRDARYWFAGSALDADGGLQLDQLIGIRRQDDYSPKG